jgi:hypothetical protein
LNRGPTDYESVALPLSYVGKPLREAALALWPYRMGRMQNPGLPLRPAATARSVIRYFVVTARLSIADCVQPGETATPLHAPPNLTRAAQTRFSIRQTRMDLDA